VDMEECRGVRSVGLLCYLSWSLNVVIEIDLKSCRISSLNTRPLSDQY